MKTHRGLSFHPAFGGKLPRNRMIRTRIPGPTSGDVQPASPLPRPKRTTYGCPCCGGAVPKDSYVCPDCGRDVS